MLPERGEGCRCKGKTPKTFMYVYVSGAIGGFAQSADRAARFADPHIAQLICRSRSYRKIAQA